MPRIDTLVILPDIAEKLATKHQVEPEEVGEVFDAKPRHRFVENGYREGEDVYMAYGRTEAGRYLVVLYILKKSHEALVISARDMEPKERSWYGKK